jgi:4'-phosphopantetheinyl transferase
MAGRPAHVWVIDLDACGIHADAGVLEARERERAAALRDPADSRRYVTAHWALRILLGDATETAPGDVRLLHEACTACGGDHGRPYVQGGPHFSLSRSAGWAAIALSPGTPVGVDLEVRRPEAELEPLRAQLLSPDERSDDLLRTWVRKEALVKASGEGLNRPLSTVPRSAGPVHDLDLPAALVGAVAGVGQFTLEKRWSSKVRQPMPDCSLPESAE